MKTKTTLTVDNAAGFYKGHTIAIDSDLYKITNQTGNTLTIRKYFWFDRLKDHLQTLRWKILEFWYNHIQKEE